MDTSLDITVFTIVMGTFCLVVVGVLFCWSLRERYRIKMKNKEINGLVWSLHLTFLFGMALILNQILNILPFLISSTSHCRVACRIGSFFCVTLLYCVYVFYHFRFKSAMTLRQQLNLTSSSSSQIWKFIEKNVVVILCFMSISLVVGPIVVDGFPYQFNEQTFCACVAPSSLLIATAILDTLYTMLTISLFVREVWETRQVRSSSSHSYYRTTVRRNLLSAGLSRLVVLATAIIMVTSQVTRSPKVMMAQHEFFMIYSVSCCLALRLCFSCASPSKQRRKWASSVIDPGQDQNQAQQLGRAKVARKLQRKSAAERKGVAIASSSSMWPETDASFFPVEDTSYSEIQTPGPAIANAEVTLLHPQVRENTNVEATSKLLNLRMEPPETLVRLCQVEHSASFSVPAYLEVELTLKLLKPPQ
eukprot:g24153.t1